MFSISPAERSRFLSELAKAREALHEEVEDIFRGFVTIAYINVVENTPQWTGHATAQWNIGRNHIDVSRSHLFLKESLGVSKAVIGDSDEKYAPTKQVGHPDAIVEAKSRQEGIVEQIKLDDIIFISNNVESLLTGAYATKLEANPNNYLRPENEGGHMVAKTVDWFNSRLAVIDPVARIQLRTVKLSASGIMETF